MMGMMGMMGMMAMMGDPATIGDPGEAKIDANWHQNLLYSVCFAQSAALHLRGCSCSEPAAAVAADAAGRMMGMMGMMGMISIIDNSDDHVVLERVGLRGMINIK